MNMEEVFKDFTLGYAEEDERYLIPAVLNLRLQNYDGTELKDLSVKQSEI